MSLIIPAIPDYFSVEVPRTPKVWGDALAAFEMSGTLAARTTRKWGSSRVIYTITSMRRDIPVLISAADIQKRIDELGADIARTYQGQSITIVGVLTGCLVFLADLIRRLDFPLRIDLVQASSYRGAATTPGSLHIQDDLLPDVRGRHILLLDDILDSGQTLGYLAGHLRKLGAGSVRIAVLLRKLGAQKVALEPDFCGFSIPDEFVIGYGLDYNDEYRNLPYIGVLPLDAR